MLFQKLSKIFVLLVVATTCVQGQNKTPVEQIAFNHLTALTKENPSLNGFQYYSTGYLQSDTITIPEIFDTFYSSVKDISVLRSKPTTYTDIVEQKNLKRIRVNKNEIGDKVHPNLLIYHFVKRYDKYFIKFETVKTKDAGTIILLVLNYNGDLVKFHESTYVSLTEKCNFVR